MIVFTVSSVLLLLFFMNFYRDPLPSIKALALFFKRSKRYRAPVFHLQQGERKPNGTKYMYKNSRTIYITLRIYVYI